MIKFLLVDLDDTILDFRKAEQVGLLNTFRHYGIEPTEETISLYLRINADLWRRLERGEVNRKQVNEGRFTELFRQLGREVDGESCAAYYLHQLSLTYDYLPGAEEAVASLAKKYRLFVASNGTSSVQIPRLAASGLDRYVEKAFISEALGQNKPSKAYFDLCFAQIPDFDPSQAIMVGDSLTSDIQGGINAGIPTCWVNTFCKENTSGIRPDYEIASLSQLEVLLETL